MSQTEISHRRRRCADSQRLAAGNAIEVRDLRKRFGRQQVLDGVTLDFPAGQITTIVGPSGSGKTVLLKHLNLLLRPDSGTIVIDGVDVTKLGGRALDAVREKLGMLFQSGALFDSMSVFDNVAFPLVEKTKLTREEIAERVHETLQGSRARGHGQQVPLGDERRDAKARRARASIGAPPENPHARRADHRPRSHSDRRDSRTYPAHPGEFSPDRRDGQS